MSTLHPNQDTVWWPPKLAVGGSQSPAFPSARSLMLEMLSVVVYSNVL
jgi:hypothetical protein